MRKSIARFPIYTRKYIGASRLNVKPSNIPGRTLCSQPTQLRISRPSMTAFSRYLSLTRFLCYGTFCPMDIVSGKNNAQYPYSKSILSESNVRLPLHLYSTQPKMQSASGPYAIALSKLSLILSTEQRASLANRPFDDESLMKNLLACYKLICDAFPHNKKPLEETSEFPDLTDFSFAVWKYEKAIQTRGLLFDKIAVVKLIEKGYKSATFYPIVDHIVFRKDLLPKKQVSNYINSRAFEGLVPWPSNIRYHEPAHYIRLDPSYPLVALSTNLAE